MLTQCAVVRPRQHRPRLDPDHPAGARCSPPRSTRSPAGSPRSGDRRAGQPERRAARRLARRPAEGAGDRGRSDGPGITEVALTTADGEIRLARGDGRHATLSVPGQPDRPVALRRRDVPELLHEELRRLDPDDVYAATVRSCSGWTSADATSSRREAQAKKAPAKKKPAKKPAKKSRRRSRRRRAPTCRLPARMADVPRSAVVRLPAPTRSRSGWPATCSRCWRRPRPRAGNRLSVLTGGTVARTVHAAMAARRRRRTGAGSGSGGATSGSSPADDQERNAGQAWVGPPVDAAAGP